jgi:hypothetical protein
VDEAANTLVGRWAFCGMDTSGFYPPDQLGEEFAADGTYYQLVAGANGSLVRSADTRTMGTWEIKLQQQNDSLAIHTYGDGVQRYGSLSTCPRTLTTIGLEVPVP